MKAILLAAAVAVGLSSCAAPSASPPKGALSTDAKPATGGDTTQLFRTMDTVPAGRGPYIGIVTPSRSNPTGQVQYGPHGEISLFAPTDDGSG
jgi:hypothetical protein